MGNKGRSRIQRPILHEIRLHLKKLRVLILEHRLAILAPFLTRQEIAQRQDITGFAYGRRPDYRTAILLGTAIGISITHLRNEAVGHRSCTYTLLFMILSNFGEV